MRCHYMMGGSPMQEIAMQLNCGGTLKQMMCCKAGLDDLLGFIQYDLKVLLARHLTELNDKDCRLRCSIRSLMCFG